ncbi:MAG: CCA tRNA nucleotidyltransferase [Microgenomates group bacterium]
MKFKFDPGVVKIAETIEKAGHEAWIVGGAIRDLIIGIDSYDWDVTTDAIPELIVPLFNESFYDNEYGTVKVAGKHIKEQFQLGESTIDDTTLYDITTFRSESGYSDKRRPDSVVWGKTIQEDLKRRDFTINAIAVNLRGEMIDPYNGQEDIKNKLIRAVGVASERFEEDALRIMRAIRLSAQLGFMIEDETLIALKEKVPNLKEISWERIGAEVMKLLATEHSADGIMLMTNCGITEIIMPELLEMKEIKQGGHHIYDVFTHSIEALRACPSPDPVVRLATLLHDIDKPVVSKQGGERGVTFYNHEVSGARTAKRIAERLKLSKKDQDRVFTLVRWHMFVYESKMTDASIRRFIRRVGKDNIHDMLALRVGDRVGGGSKATSWRLTELQKRIGEQFYEPLSIKDLNINGAEIMEILNIKPSKKVGEILNTLFEEILEDSSKNTKEYLTARVKELC